MPRGDNEGRQTTAVRYSSDLWDLWQREQVRSAQKLKFTKSHVGVIESRDMQFPTSPPSYRDINTNRLHKKYTIVLNKTVLNSEGKKWDEISQWFKIKVNINIMAVILHVPSAWGSLGFVSRYGVHACTSPKGILKISSHLEEFPPRRLAINE